MIGQPPPPGDVALPRAMAAGKPSLASWPSVSRHDAKLAIGLSGVQRHVTRRPIPRGDELFARKKVARHCLGRNRVLA